MELKIGEKFNFKGFEWVVLDEHDFNGEKAVTAIMTKAWATAPFDENNRNDWKSSSIRKRLQEELLPVLGEENLITRSMKSCDFQDDWWWTLTPWYINDVGHGNYVRYITPAGYVNITTANNSYGVAPACIFHLASLASAPSGADLIIQLQANVEELKRQIRQIKQTLKEMEED